MKVLIVDDNILTRDMIKDILHSTGHSAPIAKILFGDEEMMEIVPAIEDARSAGVDIVGPVGADSVFHQAKMGKYKAVVSLYHDQGHIAAKTLDFDRTISVTWGLPFLRTSVDHGTAFDIAGKGIASSISMTEALSVALRYLKAQGV